MRPRDRAQWRALRRRLGRPRDDGRAGRAAPPTRDTWPEAVVAAWLDRLGETFVAQHALLPGVTVDFWLPTRRLVIECQGTWFHGDPAALPPQRHNAGQARKRRHDAALQAWCERAGLTYAEVWEADLRADAAAVWRRLTSVLAGESGADTMSEELRRTVLPGGLTLVIGQGDLTAEPVAAIVNAANSHLAHGGGVAGAIVRRGGAVIQAESDEWVRRHGPVPTGAVAMTGSGSLPCRAIIHAVGPVWGGGRQGEPEALRSAVASALLLAAEEHLESVALPAISSGIFGFPKPLCAEVLIDAVVAHDGDHPGQEPLQVRLVNLDDPTVAAFVTEFDRRWPRL